MAMTLYSVKKPGFYENAVNVEAKPRKIYGVSLEALSWAAEVAGKSYGQYIVSLSEADKLRIQSEYEAYRRGMEEEYERRRAKRAAERNCSE